MTAIIKISNRAAKQIKKLLEQRGKESLGVKIFIRTGGCSGLRYHVEYADHIEPHDEVIKHRFKLRKDSKKIHELTVLIDPKAVMYLIGTTMDYIKEKFKAGFVFLNPNEASKCGCGESFSVK